MFGACYLAGFRGAEGFAGLFDQLFGGLFGFSSGGGGGRAGMKRTRDMYLPCKYVPLYFLLALYFTSTGTSKPLFAPFCGHSQANLFFCAILVHFYHRPSPLHFLLCLLVSPWKTSTMGA